MSTTSDFESSQKLPAVPFTIRQLECFIATAECGSITAAAVALHASDSAVSDSISAMERALNAQLFKRHRSRGATLTSDGLTILPIARQIASHGAELAASVGRDQAAVVGPVRVGLINTLASVVLPRLLINTKQRHPGIHIEHRTGDLPELLEAIDRGELDLIVSFDIEVPPEFHRASLTTTEAMLVVSSEHPLAEKEEISLSDVADEPMIMLDIVASRMHALEIMSSRGVNPRIAHRTSDYELCRALVGRGLGYTLLMRRHVSPETWDGRRVVYIPLSPRPRPVDVLVAWPHNPLPPRIAAVVESAKLLSEDLAINTAG